MSILNNIINKMKNKETLFNPIIKTSYEGDSYSPPQPTPNKQGAPVHIIVNHLSKILEDKIIEIEKAALSNEALEKIERLESKLNIVEEFVSKIKKIDDVSEENEKLRKSSSELTTLLSQQNEEIKQLKKDNRQLEKDNDILVERMVNIKDGDSIEKLKKVYFELLEFAFFNINPISNLDKKEARFYWENAIK